MCSIHLMPRACYPVDVVGASHLAFWAEDDALFQRFLSFSLCIPFFSLFRSFHILDKCDHYKASLFRVHSCSSSYASFAYEEEEASAKVAGRQQHPRSRRARTANDFPFRNDSSQSSIACLRVCVRKPVVATKTGRRKRESSTRKMSSFQTRKEIIPLLSPSLFPFERERKKGRREKKESVFWLGSTVWQVATPQKPFREKKRNDYFDYFCRLQLLRASKQFSGRLLLFIGIPQGANYLAQNAWKKMGNKTFLTVTMSSGNNSKLRGSQAFVTLDWVHSYRRHSRIYRVTHSQWLGVHCSHA